MAPPCNSNSDFITHNLSVFVLPLFIPPLVAFGCSDSIYGSLLGSVTLVILSAALTHSLRIEHFVNGALVLFALYFYRRGSSATEPDLQLRDEPAAALNQLEISGCMPHVRPNSHQRETTARTTDVSRFSPACRAMGKAVGRRLAALPELRRQTAYPVVS